MPKHTKKCASCKEDKPLSEFHSCPSKSDGRHSWCKACYNAWRKEKKRAARLAKYDQWTFNNEGKVCPMCGQRKPLSEYYKNKAREHGVNSYCKQCNNERVKQDRLNNPERYRERYRRDYLNGGKEKRTQWAQKHREQVRGYGKKHHHNNREKHSERMKRSYLENKPQYKARRHKRRAIECEAEGRFTSSDLDALYEDQNGRCAYCGIPVSWDGIHGMHLDHIQPLSRGGTNWPSNLALTCAECNLSKARWTLDEWMARRG